MILKPEARRQVGTVVICHSEPLIGLATAALIERQGVAMHAVNVNSVAHLLSRLDHTVDIAVVFDGTGDEVSDLFEAMHHRGLTTPVLVVSSSADARYAASVLEAGAAGLTYTWCDPAVLLESILDVMSGQIVVPSEQRADIVEALRARRMERSQARETLARLSALDVRILRGLCDGLTVTQIAGRLLLSPHTVRGHVGVIGAALGAHGQLGIAAVGRHLLAAAQMLVVTGDGVQRPHAAHRFGFRTDRNGGLT